MSSGTKIESLKRQITMAKSIEQALQVELQKLLKEQSNLVEKMKSMGLDDDHFDFLEMCPTNIAKDRWKEIVNLLQEIHTDELELHELQENKKKIAIENEKRKLKDELRRLSSLSGIFNEETSRTLLTDWCRGLKEANEDDVGITDVNFKQRVMEETGLLNEELSFTIQYQFLTVHVRIKAMSKLIQDNPDAASSLINHRSPWKLVSSAVESDVASHEIAKIGNDLLRSSESVSFFLMKVYQLIYSKYSVPESATSLDSLSVLS